MFVFFLCLFTMQCRALLEFRFKSDKIFYRHMQIAGALLSINIFVCSFVWYGFGKVSFCSWTICVHLSALTHIHQNTQIYTIYWFVRFFRQKFFRFSSSTHSYATEFDVDEIQTNDRCIYSILWSLKILISL